MLSWLIARMITTSQDHEAARGRETRVLHRITELCRKWHSATTGTAELYPGESGNFGRKFPLESNPVRADLLSVWVDTQTGNMTDEAVDSLPSAIVGHLLDCYSPPEARAILPHLYCTTRRMLDEANEPITSATVH